MTEFLARINHNIKTPAKDDLKIRNEVFSEIQEFKTFSSKKNINIHNK